MINNMKIYVVTHFYDNGESYEDYREYTDYFMFSTEAKAYVFYCDMILSDYEGRYSMYEKELDTQKQTLLEVSPWVKCTSYYDEHWQGEYDPEDYYPDPMDSYKEYWRWDDDTSYEDISEEEDKAWFEYVTTPGTNYQEWEEVNKEIEERKKAILFEELNEMLKELC
jgi:hypothetical protein